MAIQTIPLSTLSAVLPDGLTNNVPPAQGTFQGTQATRKWHGVLLDFDGAGSVIESCWWTFPLPTNYVSGGTLNVLWFANATANAIKWQAQVGAITPGDTDTPFEHAFAAASSPGATNINTTEANRLTLTAITLTMDSAAAGDLIELTLFRDPADAADTSTADGRVAAAGFDYTS